MAILIKDLVIINDNRELLGVNTAGITTALYVGDSIQLDAQSGVITATKFVGSGASLTDLPPGSFISSTAPATREDGSSLQEGDIYYDSSVLRQFTRYDNGGDPIWVDSNPAASAAVLKVNVGVDTALIDLSTEKLIIAGTDDEIVVGVNTSTNTVTIGLPDDVSIGGTMSAAFFEGDGSKLTNISSGSVDLTGTYQDFGGVNISGPGIALTVANDVSIGGSVIAGSFYGDGSNLTGVGLATDCNIVTTGNIQAGVMTATTSLEATGAGVGLTVTNDVSVGGSMTANVYYGDGSNLEGLVVGAANSVTSFDNQDNVDYPLPFLSAVGAGASIYTDKPGSEDFTYNPSTGTLKSKEFDALSDIRFKTNINKIDGATDKVAQLRGVEYDWVNGSGSSVGVIAQEVQLVYPQLVSDTEERMTVNYNGLVGLLVQAVNELSRRLDKHGLL